MHRKDAFLALFFGCTLATVALIVGLAIGIDKKCACGDRGLCCLEDANDSAPISCNGECVCFSKWEGAVACRYKKWEAPVWGIALLVCFGISGLIGAVGWVVLGAAEKWGRDDLNNDKDTFKDVRMTDMVVMESFQEWGLMADGRMGPCI
ncbi:hypothetical protein BSKO_13749 [Bryopsis sp. KO-2023]|nr:hypothetical protein BSKO_13749 [Bryopsis sp. KO-2023]